MESTKPGEGVPPVPAATPVHPPPSPPAVVPEQADHGEMHKKVVRGSAFTLGGIAASRVIRLGSNLVLTRLLPPGAIGIMNLANIFMQGLQMFSDIGIRPAIIQSKRGDDEDFLNTAWTMSIIRGFVLWALACAFAFPYAWFYGTPALQFIIPVVGITAAIQGFNSTSFATANRKLALGRLTMLELAAQVINTLVVLIWAYFSATPWALVAGGVSNAVSFLVLGFLWLPGVKHKFRWEKESAKELIKFGRWVFISTSITFLAVQCDPIAVGKIAGATALAIYGIGKMWGTMASEVFQQLLTRVFFPVISDMARSGNLDRNRICELRTLLLLPVAVGTGALFVAAEPAIRFMYPQLYWGAGSIFALSAISAWVNTITNTYSIVLLSAGKLKNMTASTAAKTIAFFALAYPAYTHWEVEGIAIALIAAEVIGLLPMMWGAHKLNVAMPVREIGLSIIGAVFGLAMYGVYTLAVNVSKIELVGVIAVGVLTGGACLYCVKLFFGHLRRPR